MTEKANIEIMKTRKKAKGLWAAGGKNEGSASSQSLYSKIFQFSLAENV